MSRKTRLDLYLVSKGFVKSRHQAQQLIRAGKVRTKDGELLDKPGQEISHEIQIELKNSPRFVSRGGEKLIAAFDAFSLKVEKRICLDCGISTGGFTDCLLQNGASLVYGIDVGYGQTAWSLRNDSRVVLLERTNIRNVTQDNLYGMKQPWPNFLVADLSFISLSLVIKTMTLLLGKEQREAVLLVKPQFEVGREKVGKGGVVRDIESHIYALRKVIASSIEEGWSPKGVIASPLIGPAGNHEYLLWLGTGEDMKIPDLKKLVSQTLH